MSAGDRPNFFILLGLDPRAKWDQAAFERRLEEKRREWSRASSGVGKPATDAKRWIELMPQIKQVLGDDAQRQTEATEALAESDRERKAKLEQFDETLRIAQAKGHVRESEITAWTKTFAGVLTGAEIRKRVTVPIQTGAAPTGAPVAAPQLDPTLAKTIRENLESLGLSDLYAFLGMPRATDTATLAQKARTINSDLQRNMNKTTELTMRQGLSGNAMDVFKTDDARSRYDETLRMAGLEALLHKYEEAFRAAGEVDERQAALYLQDARSAGWDAQAALDRLKALAAQRRWAIRVGGAEVISKQQVCGNCRQLNEPSAQYCSRCSAQLKLPCPSCGNQVESDARACPRCGFSVGNRYLVDSQLEESQRLRNARQLNEALALVTSAEQAWAGAKPDDPRAQRIQQQRAAVEAERQKQGQTLERLRRLMDVERKFFEARTVLDGLPPNALTDQTTLRRRTDDAIAQAQRLLAQARAQPQGSDNAVALLQQALQVCADYQEARDLLARNPPAPPSQLTAQMGGGMVSLRWQASPTRGSLRYRVVRKSGSQPVSSQDGATLATVSGAYYDDTAPEVGAPLYYAVFTDRETVPSTQGAGLSQPVMFTPDVTNAVARVNDRLVEMSWIAPANVKRILITRKEGSAPRDQRDGMLLTILDLQHLTDHGLRNDTAYFYRIVCQYTDQNGGERLSPGLVVEATPQIPPAPINEFTIEQRQASPTEREAILRWMPPAKGKVVVLKSQGEPRVSAGAIIPEERLRDHGQVLEGRTDTLTDRWPQAGACFYTPVVIFQRMGYIGATQQFAAVDDVRDLKARNQGATVRLTWTWPAGCQNALVATSDRQWPGRQDVTATLRPIAKLAYDRLGFVELPGQRERDLYIIVYAEMSIAGATVHASGASSGARALMRVASKVSLEYEIKRMKPMFGKPQVFLRLRPHPAAVLPAMIIRSKQYGLPFNKADGEFVERVGPFTTPGETLDVPLPAKDFARETFGKLFLEDDSEYDVVDVNHPAKERLRLDA